MRRPLGYPTHPQALGEHLLKWRKELGLFQRDAAARIGVRAETLLGWERGLRQPAIDQWPAIIGVLGFDANCTEANGVVGEIERARRRLGWSLDRTSRFLGIDPGTLARWKSGASVPDFFGDKLDRFLSLEVAGLGRLQQAVPAGTEGWTFGQHLRARRVRLVVTRREVAVRLGACSNSVLNWEKDRQLPEVQFWPRLLQFLEYDPSPPAKTTSERIEQQRRRLGWTYEQAANFIGVDAHTLLRWKAGRGMRLLRRDTIDQMVKLAEQRLRKPLVNAWLSDGTSSPNNKQQS